MTSRFVAGEITIETEALTYNRLFCYRRFTICDEDGSEIILHGSYLCPYGRDSRKVRPVEPEIVAPINLSF